MHKRFSHDTGGRSTRKKHVCNILILNVTAALVLASNFGPIWIPQTVKFLFFASCSNPRNLMSPALASPAMGHWGTCSPSTSNCFDFSGHFRAAQTLWHSTPYGCLSSKNYSLSFVPPPPRTKSWRRHWSPSPNKRSWPPPCLSAHKSWPGRRPWAREIKVLKTSFRKRFDDRVSANEKRHHTVALQWSGLHQKNNSRPQTNSQQQ